MIAPIDIECPACAATAGTYCTSITTDPKIRTFHHAERIDAAFRQIAHRRDDPHALRETLRAAIGRLETRQDLDHGDLSFIITVREAFEL